MQLTAKEQQNYCYFAQQADGEELACQYSEDLIFIYPNSCVERFDNGATFDSLQKLFVCIKELTSINPTKKIPSDTDYSRITIGYYRKPNSNIAKYQGDKGNLISIPWKRLEDSREPLDVCTHEMVHPFFWCSLFQGTENEVWGEGFCDFLRGVLSGKFECITKRNGIEWWKKKIKEADKAQVWNSDKREWKDNSVGGAAAGQLLIEVKRLYYEDRSKEGFLELFINDEVKVKEFITNLFSNYLDPALHMRGNFFLTDRMMSKLREIKNRYSITTPDYIDKRIKV